MGAFVRRVVVVAAACGACGCAKPDKSDNSAIQTPGDQPIGMPVSLDGQGKGGKLDGKGGPAKKQPTVEIKD